MNLVFRKAYRTAAMRARIIMTRKPNKEERIQFEGHFTHESLIFVVSSEHTSQLKESTLLKPLRHCDGRSESQ